MTRDGYFKWGFIFFRQTVGFSVGFSAGETFAIPPAVNELVRTIDNSHDLCVGKVPETNLPARSYVEDAINTSEAATCCNVFSRRKVRT